MIVVNIFEAKAKLSEYLDMAAQGERVLICKRNRPIVELHAVQSARTAPRPIGLGRGRITVPLSFFDSLPDDVLGGFEGASLPAAPPPMGGARYPAGLLNVAERDTDAGFGKRSRRAKRSQ
ncbi:MAG TPA: type II toxin-antitoxin system prevent-host-death family antitoxin [Vicinamibacterales bacterium]|nr:type II toxin-antitoxin system prevent-host-death family antitoxin [Vicinamibacterales bacterium]